MTSSFLENVKIHLFSQAVTRLFLWPCSLPVPVLAGWVYAFVVLCPGTPEGQNRIPIFRVNYILKILILKILILSFYLCLEKKSKKIGRHRTYDLSGRLTLTRPPQISRIIRYKTLRSENIYQLYNCILHCTWKQLFSIITLKRRRKNNTMFNGCPPGRAPGTRHWSSGNQ